MKLLIKTLLVPLILISFSCQPKTKASKEIASEPAPEKAAVPAQDLEGYETAYFASGCFWCTVAVFESVKGVKKAVAGLCRWNNGESYL